MTASSPARFITKAAKLARGRGKNFKKDAEGEAARAALEVLRNENSNPPLSNLP